MHHRARAMVHLPALVLSEQINQVIQAVNKIGLAVRGLYGEGTEALGNLFQVSNQTTLGEKEEDIIARLHKVIEQIIEHEQNARQMLAAEKAETLLDHIGRGYGILRHAYSHELEGSAESAFLHEAGHRPRLLPRGLPPAGRRALHGDAAGAPAEGHAAEIAADERDALRAEIIRAKLANFPKPDGKKAIERGREERNKNEAGGAE